MENWRNLYLEMAEIISRDLTDEEQEAYGELNTLQGQELSSPIRWVDLWHNQVNFLDEELEFPTPSVFLSFRTKQVDDLGEKVQQVVLQIDCYLFYETFSNTFTGSFNQEDALLFISMLDFINGRFHGTEGENYSSMRKVGFNPEDTGGAGNLYRITFECIIRDETAAKFVEDGSFTGLEIESNIDFQIQ